MNRNLNVTVVDMLGTPLKYPTGKSKPVDPPEYDQRGHPVREPITEERTYCRVIVEALGYEVPGEGKPPQAEITGEVKVERMALGLKLRDFIGKDEEVELSEREVALIKQAMDPKFSTMVIGPLWKLLEAK